MNFFRLDLASASVVSRGPLPEAIAGWQAQPGGLVALADLSAALDPCPAEWVGRGFWPAVTETPPNYDGVTEYLAEDEPVPDTAARVVRIGWTVMARPDAREQVAAAMLAAVKTERQRRLSDGYPLSNGRVQIVGDGDRANLVSAYNMARDGRWPASGAPWRLLDNSTVTLTAEQVMSMALGAGAYYSGLVWALSAHEAALAALLSDPTVNTAHLRQYDTSAGWPSP